MPIIYHITSAPDWNEQKGSGLYASSSLKEEGFIHCSQEGQVAGVLDRYFKDRTGLVKLSIDTERLRSQLIYEWSPSIADTFPHIYGPINTDAVTAVDPL
ncbi:MAG: DUF952 domain-containing protein [Candidatus Pseudobacter hemicellulosilyticus]|uniref:DUF952 domain-containing protein n=1 Tax=Candidatus Pseudobacter hemicellulosilyticus TaxID=3121375 RepID=A0AAJ6BHK5_9BACT|nr:MAG: DUF952 domain-containing protein [Pseudobacter sp.]